MWKCENCQEEIKDKYNNCWNCGQPNPAGEPQIKYVRVLNIEPYVEIQPVAELEVKPQIETVKVDVETKFANQPQVQTDNLSSFQPEVEESATSIIWTIIPVLLWLIAFVGTGYFAYLSNQKTTDFDNQIAQQAQSFNNQKSQFSFPTTALPDRKNLFKVEGNIKTKVLPLNRTNNEVAELYYSLPDDLRATDLDEVKTIFWLDCQTEKVGKQSNDSAGLQEKCNTYLVERETAKFIGIQDFIGIPPAFTKKTESGDETGKVPAERYIAYLREKQIETERGEMKYPSDSPNHHLFNKSELTLAIGLLVILGAIGLGWLFFRIKSMFNQK